MPKEFFSYVYTYTYLQIYISTYLGVYSLQHMDMGTENMMWNADYFYST